jgi:hypothetical protein
MAPNKQVSPVIRISQGERDASARATHLEAATRKFLVTTNERKQMSTTTNFKRIALVAVASLGLGLLSSAPSQAAFSGTAGSQLTLTATAGTGTLAGAKSDSTTAGTISVTGLSLVAGDSYTITSAKKSWPALTTGAATPNLLFMLKDTSTSTGASFAAFTTTGGVMDTHEDSSTSVNAVAPASAPTYVNSTFFAYQESTTASGKDRIAGTYVYTVTVQPMAQGNPAGTTQTIDLTITIATPTTASLVANSAYSTAFIGVAANATTDEAISVLATASDTPRAYISVSLRNATGSTGVAARESVTITTTIGQVGTSTNRGRSVVLKYNEDTNEDYSVYSDGTAGTGTITISTPSVKFPTKSITFYAAKPATLVASVATPNLRVGTNDDAVRVTAKDANGNDWGGALYAYASTAADALIAGSNATPVLCTWDADDGRHECGIAGTLAGTAKIKVMNYSTVALGTAADLVTAGSMVTSNEVSVVVNSNPVASFKLSFDKASYAPSERARIYVTPVDSAGKEIAVTTTANLLASGGITTSSQLSFSGTTTAESLTAVSITTVANSSATTGAKAGAAVYTVFMPASGGTVTITATGGSSLPLAAQVAVTASATVTDSGAAALAAVNALATTVASLRTLITTLTNLVLKIQKKVKA